MELKDALDSEMAAADGETEAAQQGRADADADAELDAIDPRLRRFLDVPIQVRIELDRKKITLAEALSFRERTVIQLDRSAGENVDLLLDGLPVAAGEIVEIEDMMGVRLTDLRRPPRQGGR